MAVLACAGVAGMVARGDDGVMRLHRVPNEYPTIQMAINAAAPGEEVVVSPGVFPGPIRVIKGIVVHGAGEGETTIAGGAGGPVVTLEETAAGAGVIEGFTIAGGDGLNGGGLFLAGAVAVRDCTVSGNFAERGGGACLAGDPLLQRVRFIGNSAGCGGGIYVSFDARPVLDDCQFERNVADLGGGVFVSPSNSALTRVWITGAAFTGNTATRGGGIMALMSPVDVDGSTFLMNGSSGSGGAVGLIRAPYSNFIGTDFRCNQAGLEGGAISAEDRSSVHVDGCTLFGNAAEGGGALLVDSRSAARVTRSEFDMNVPDHVRGPWLNLHPNQIGVEPACEADLAPPFGVIDVADMIEFTGLYTSGDPGADLVAPIGVVNVDDAQRFWMLYVGGCSR